ncbi:MAG TPA: D-glycerate dehydrogenase [Acidobacteriota bacterium]|nr:D-glycerate dehydrogenase [Acidobacteriota bacterium]
MKRVFVTCDIGSEALDKLRRRGCHVETHQGQGPPSQEELRRAMDSGAEVLISTVIDPVTASVLEAGRGTLKAVTQYGVGYDNIDVEAASRLGIAVTNTPDVLTDATAEFAFFMLGDLARKLYNSERLVRENRWTRWHSTQPFLGVEVTGKTVGIIGLGRIGKAFACKWLGWGVDILAHTRTPDEDFARSFNKCLEITAHQELCPRQAHFRFASQEEVLSQSDFLSLHVPLTDETRGLIDAPVLKAMKSSALLVNTTRGPVVDEEAIVEALKNHVIAGAALDVYHQEPLPADSPLRDPALEDRLRLYHHFGSGTRETRLSAERDVGMAGRAVYCALRILEGDPPTSIPYLVNPSAFE